MLAAVLLAFVSTPYRRLARAYAFFLPLGRLLFRISLQINIKF